MTDLAIKMNYRYGVGSYMFGSGNSVFVDLRVNEAVLWYIDTWIPNYDI